METEKLYVGWAMAWSAQKRAGNHLEDDPTDERWVIVVVFRVLAK